MRRAPAKPVRACILRKWGPVSHVTFEAPPQRAPSIMITKNKTLPTTTLYYKTCTKYFTVSIYLIALKYCLYINRRRSSLEAKKQFGSTF